MAELINTTVHTNFREEKDGVVITGTAVINKDNEIISIDGGSITYNGNQVSSFHANQMEVPDKLTYNLNGTRLEYLVEVLPVLKGIEASILVSLKESTEIAD